MTTKETSTTPRLLQWLVYGWVVIFIANLYLTGLLLFGYNETVQLIPKVRTIVGLLILFGLTTLVFAAEDKIILSHGWHAGCPLAFVYFFTFYWLDSPDASLYSGAPC